MMMIASSVMFINTGSRCGILWWKCILQMLVYGIIIILYMVNHSSTVNHTKNVANHFSRLDRAKNEVNRSSTVNHAKNVANHFSRPDRAKNIANCSSIVNCTKILWRPISQDWIVPNVANHFSRPDCAKNIANRSSIVNRTKILSRPISQDQIAAECGESFINSELHQNCGEQFINSESHQKWLYNKRAYFSTLSIPNPSYLDWKPTINGQVINIGQNNDPKLVGDLNSVSCEPVL